MEDQQAEAQAWFDKGLGLSELGRWEEAVACYDKALEIGPLQARFWSVRGLVSCHVCSVG
jgi:tetratricopeptide (TPR) repeat protein